MTHPGDPFSNPQPPAGGPVGSQPLPGWQQPMGQPQAAPLAPQQGRFGPEGEIVLTVQGSPMTSNMLTPKVSIDGYPVPASYGINRLPVPAGRHTVSAYATWLVKYGQAAYDVEVQPGQSVPVFYAAPMMQFMKGRMGPVKQKRPGLWLLLVVILIIVAFVVIPVAVGQ